MVACYFHDLNLTESELNIRYFCIHFRKRLLTKARIHTRFFLIVLFLGLYLPMCVDVDNFLINPFAKKCKLIMYLSIGGVL